MEKLERGLQEALGQKAKDQAVGEAYKELPSVRESRNGGSFKSLKSVQSDRSAGVLKTQRVNSTTKKTVQMEELPSIYADPIRDRSRDKSLSQRSGQSDNRSLDRNSLLLKSCTAEPKPSDSRNTPSLVAQSMNLPSKMNPLHGYKVPLPTNLDKPKNICILDWKNQKDVNKIKKTFLDDLVKKSKLSAREISYIQPRNWYQEQSSVAINGHPNKFKFLQGKREMLNEQIARME